MYFHSEPSGKPIKRKVVALMIAVSFFSALRLQAQNLRIAVSANAKALIAKLQEDFQKRTGIKSEAIINSSGKLTTQILNGAPFDVFLSADTEFPDRIYSAGFGLSKPRVYALGSLIVCGLDANLVNNWQTLIRSKKINKLAIANPKIAPYGKAALEALGYYQLLEPASTALVYGESISQVNTYILSGSVNIGFTTESVLYEQIPKALKWVRVDPKAYLPIRQSAVLITRANKAKAMEARKFYDYLFSAQGQKIIGQSGYHLPKSN